ncbi:BTB/POZ domain-containing protein POB1-like protein, partial [Tanacetum coccineum]
DEVLNLPLAGVEAIIASDDLQVASEDAVYDFVLKWSRIQYLKIEERREILATCLVQFIRFPYMTCRKLRKVMACNDFEHEFSQKVVVEALFFKAEAPHRQRTLLQMKTQIRTVDSSSALTSIDPLKSWNLNCHVSNVWFI